jgi:hypothetical protein
MKQAMPQMRKRPQKLLRRSAAMSLPCGAHVPGFSHLSWMRCRSPFSDSVRIAVERSTARGESRWNACTFNYVVGLTVS